MMCASDLFSVAFCCYAIMPSYDFEKDHAFGAN